MLAQETADYPENVFQTVIVPKKQNVTTIIASTPVKNRHLAVKMLYALFPIITQSVNVRQTVKVIPIKNVPNLNVLKIVIAHQRRLALIINAKTPVVYLVRVEKMLTVFQETILVIVHARLDIREILCWVVFLFSTARTIEVVRREPSVLIICVSVS